MNGRRRGRGVVDASGRLRLRLGLRFRLRLRLRLRLRSRLRLGSRLRCRLRLRFRRRGRSRSSSGAVQRAVRHVRTTLGDGDCLDHGRGESGGTIIVGSNEGRREGDEDGEEAHLGCWLLRSE